MEIRAQLMLPGFPGPLLDRLVELAGGIVSADSKGRAEKIAEFNLLAGTELDSVQRQGLSSAIDHKSWVQNLAIERAVGNVTFISEEEIVELISRLCSPADYTEHEKQFWLKILESFLPDSQVAERISHPGKFFGEGDNSRQLTPEEILKAVFHAE